MSSTAAEVRADRWIAILDRLASAAMALSDSLVEGEPNLDAAASLGAAVAEWDNETVVD